MNPLAKCNCVHCAGSIEFESDAAGQEAACPHCGKMTWIDLPERFAYSPPTPAPVATEDYSELTGWLARWWENLLDSPTWFKVALAIFLMGWVANYFSPADRPEFWFSAGKSFLATTILVFLWFLYFLPYYLARQNKKQNTQAIFVLNLFLGWTFIGWVCALVWAHVKD